MYTSKAPLIAEVCKQGGSWPALWDTVRHLGSRHTVGLQHYLGCKRTMEASHNLALCAGVILTDHVLSSHNQAFQLPSLTPESLLTETVDREVNFVYSIVTIFCVHAPCRACKHKL